MLGKWPAVARRRDEHDVAVEDRAGGIGDRLVHVVAFDEHGVEPGDAAALGRHRPARAAAAAGRTPTAGSHASRAARRPRGRPRAAPWRSGSGCPSSAPRRVPWSRNHSAMRVAVNAARRRTSAGSSEVATTTTERAQALLAKVVLDELAHLTAALADQREHRDVGARCPGRSSTAGSTCRRRSRRRSPGAGRGRTGSGCRSRARPSGSWRVDHRPRRSGCGGRAARRSPIRSRRAAGRRRSGRPSPSRTRPSSACADRDGQRLDRAPRPVRRSGRLGGRRGACRPDCSPRRRPPRRPARRRRARHARRHRPPLRFLRPRAEARPVD